MKKVKVLPADVYTVVNKTILQELDKKIITMLYQPIIGYQAVSLYLTLVDDLDKRELMSDDLTHHHLMSTMQLKLEDIVEARERLEAIGLLRTYFKSDHINYYVYVLYSPLSPNEFFNNPILNIVLYNNLGKKEYDNVVNCFKIPKINLRDYEEISCGFSEVFSPVGGNSFIEQENIKKRNNRELVIQNKIDFSLLQEAIPKRMISDKCFTEEVKNLINQLAYIYDIDTINMANLVRDNLNEKGLLDKVNFRRACRNSYQFEQDGKLPTLIYNKQPEYLKSPVGDDSPWARQVYAFENVSPSEYLRSKYKTGEPSNRDLKLVESLMVDLKLNPGVVNVLLAYVLEINNQKLNKAYIETVAGQWKRLNIETVEEAMIASKEHHKQTKKKLEKQGVYKAVPKAKGKEEKLPEWFDQELSKVDVSLDEKEEMDNLLREFQ